MRSSTRAAAVYTPFPLPDAYYLFFLWPDALPPSGAHGRVEQWQLTSLISWRLAVQVRPLQPVATAQCGASRYCRQVRAWKVSRFNSDPLRKNGKLAQQQSDRLLIDR